MSKKPVADTPETALTSSPQLPPQALQRGLDWSQWNAICNTLYPGANPNSVLLVIDYCKARKLDPFKKPCHIVSMQVKSAKTGQYEWRDVVLPGIYEYRMTAHRTGEYAGHSTPEYGPEEDFMGVKAPAWCSMTVYRYRGHQKPAEFPVRVYFRECVTLRRDKEGGGFAPNERWKRAPIQMLTKVCEAAALREAFPDELGGEHTADEMEGRVMGNGSDVVDADVGVDPPPQPEGYAEFLSQVMAAAEEGLVTLNAAWAQADEACRLYLTAHTPSAWEDLKATARQHDVDAKEESAGGDRDASDPPV